MSDQSDPSLERADRSATGGRLRSLAEPRLGVDARALAAFRISLGLLVIADLVVYRVPGLVTFYTDAGVLPRGVHAELFPSLASVSLHALTGSARGQGLLFALAVVVACCLLAGYQTRAATVVSFAFLASLHARNPYVLNGGDTILLSFLFLGIFLPLGRRWSFDAVRRSAPPSGRRVVSVAAAATLLYFVLIYATNAAFKFRSESWIDGVAVQQIFQLEPHIVLLGPYLADFPTLLVAINWLWIALLAASPLLVLLAGRLRIVLVAAFVAAHLGMAATMRLGLFPFVMTAGLLLFLPPQLWSRTEVAVLDRLPNPTQRVPATLASAHPATLVSVPPDVRRGIRRIGSLVVVCFLVATLLWQAAAVGVVDSPETLEVAPEEYSWAMFAPNPPEANRWYVADAAGPEGSVDALGGGGVDREPPPDAADAYPTVLWHRYLTEMRSAGETRYEPLAAYLCDNAADGAEELTVYYLEQPVGPSGPTGDPVAHERIQYRCHST